MNRFFVEKSNIKDNTIMVSDKEDIRHISKVLRLKTKDIIEVSDGESYEYLAEISKATQDFIEADIVEKYPFQREPLLDITLYQGVPKQSKMETIVQKSVELGASSIIPVFTERTVVQDKGHFNKKVERWQKISYGASKQSKRGIVPKVENPLTFDEMLQDIQDKQLVLLLYEDEKNTKIKDILRKQNGIKNMAIIVGPEGGFSEKEVIKIIGQGAVSVSLGKTILRTETAGAAALAMVSYELEG